MSAFAVVILDELVHRCLEMPFPERNHAIQTLLLHRSDEPLRVCVPFGARTASAPHVGRFLQQGPYSGTRSTSVPVADQHAIRQAVGPRHRPRGLAHERLVRMRRRPEDLHPPRRQLDDNHRIERHESPPRPHFGREEIRTGDLAPVRPQKRLPRCRTLRHGRDAVRPQDPCNR